MKIKLLKNYSTYRLGAVVDCEDATALRLIADGMAERDSQMTLIETASLEPAGERADVTPRRTRRVLPQPHDTDAAGG